MTKVPLAEGGRDVLVYTTISGAVGALIPFISPDDVDFMQTLEMVSDPEQGMSEENGTDNSTCARRTSR